MRLNCLKCSKPGANKSTHSFCPDITQERLWQAIKLTNYSTMFGHMQDPRVLFISCASDQVQRFEVPGKDKEGTTACSAADHATRKPQESKAPMPATVHGLLICASLPTLFYWKNKFMSLTLML